MSKHHIDPSVLRTERRAVAIDGETPLRLKARVWIALAVAVFGAGAWATAQTLAVKRVEERVTASDLRTAAIEVKIDEVSRKVDMIVRRTGAASPVAAK